MKQQLHIMSKLTKAESKRFDKYWNGPLVTIFNLEGLFPFYRSWKKEAGMCLKQYLAEACVRANKKTLKGLLKEGHGGGNWRRLILSKIEDHE